MDLGLTDEQRAIFRQRRTRWDAIRGDQRIRLTECSEPNVYEIAPMTESNLFDAGRGRYAQSASIETQTGGQQDDQDCQTDIVLVRCC